MLETLNIIYKTHYEIANFGIKYAAMFHPFKLIVSVMSWRGNAWKPVPMRC